MKEYIKIKGINRQICSRCIYDETVAGISFDEAGVCNYCHTMDELRNQYGTGTEEGKKKLEEIIKKIKREGKGKKYDCIVGVSGGTDSSYMVAKMIEWGLRPLAVHYDNTWNTAIATENIKKVLGKLNVDLYTYVVDNKEVDDIFLSFLKASVREIDGATDLAYAEIMYRVASKYKVKYVFEGHSFMAEGISPLSNAYFDGMYIKSIHKQYGKVPLKTYPLMTFWHFMKWTAIKRIKKIRPLWYINYSKNEAREYLQKEFDWQYYGGHNCENRIVAFQHCYYEYHKFNMDNRNLSLAAAVRSGVMNREQAIHEYYETEPYMEDDLFEYFKNRLNLTDEEFERLMELPPKRYTDYKTYKKLFKALRPLFYILAKKDLVPMSFYLKYTA